MRKRKWTIGLVAILVALIVIGGIVYLIIGRALTNQGLEAHNALDARLAAQKYGRVIRHYPPALGEFVALATENHATCQMVLDARRAADDHDYQTAITLYAQFRATHPADPLIALVDREHPAAYLAWAKEAEQAGTPRTAIERYQALLHAYPSSSQAGKASQAIPAAYYVAGTNDRAQTEYANAIDSFRLARETDSGAQWTAQARQAIWETYREWGNAQREQGEYEHAISHYQQAIAETDDVQVVAAMERAIAESILAWTDMLRAQGDYKQAIALCTAAMTDLPVANWQEQIHEAIQTTTLEWADALYTAQDYQAAIATWQRYVAAYPGDNVGQVELKVARAHAAWAQRHWDNGEYQDAFSLYETLIAAYPDAVLAEQARSMLSALHYDWAAAAHRTQAYETAVAHYQASIALEEQQLLANGQIRPRSGSSHQKPPVVKASESAARAWEATAAALVDWGIALSKETDYEQASITLQIVIDDYKQSQIITAAQTAAADAYLDWGDVLSRTKAYQDAVVAYEKAIAVDIESLAAFSARARLPGAYLAWGQSLQDDGAYDDALVTYQTILDAFPEHQAADTAAVAIGETYNAWGTALHHQGAYADAMLKFGLAIETTDIELVVIEARAGYDDALWALAHLADATGKEIIDDAVTTACQGEAAISPAVGLAMAQGDTGGGKAAINSNLIVLPTALKAVMPAHLRTAACLTTGFTEIQRCAYSNDYVLVRQQVWWKITVRDARSGAWLAQNTFTGSMPKSCPKSYLFYAKIAYLDGSRPSSEKIIDWLRDVAK